MAMIDYLFVLFMVLLFAWIIVSRLLAWLVTPSKDPNEVLEMWSCVFLAPILIAMLVNAFAKQWIMIQMHKAGMPVTPAENPMEYIL